MTTEGGRPRRPINPYYDLTHEAGRLNFHRLFNEELTTMGDYQRLRTNAVRPIAVYDFERYFDEAHGNDALIPYMAMTFVDRFLSKGSIPIADVLCDAGKPSGVRSVCIYGGASKGPQISSLKAGVAYPRLSHSINNEEREVARQEREEARQERQRLAEHAKKLKERLDQFMAQSSRNDSDLPPPP